LFIHCHRAGDIHAQGQFEEVPSVLREYNPAHDLGAALEVRVADAELVAAAGRDGEFAWVSPAPLSPSKARGHVGFTARLEAAITLIRDRANPQPALRFDASRWVGQGTILVHEGPEILPDFRLGGVVFHDNIIAAKVSGRDEGG
jgi:hypothetical protein